jgi:uncharacterized protein YcbK (DUF882 family)
MRYFDPAEFECGCGLCGLGYHHMDEGLLKRIDNARHAAAVPFTITSAVRCDHHNELVGGSDTSSHLSGLAVDIAATNSANRMKIIYGLMAAGFNRIGIAGDFIHVDVDHSKSSGVMWLYG